MLKVAVIYHSEQGHTEKQAQFITKGVELVPGITTVDLIKASDACQKIDELKQYDGMIFGSPTYMGSAAAGLKTFMEASSKVWMTQDWKDKLAGGFTNTHSLAGDNFNVLVQLVTLASQHGMIWVSLGISNESGADDQESGAGHLLNRVGSNLGATAQSENDSPDVTPPIGDLKTAELYGKRFGEAVVRWNK
jgi:multimeric flavodoxin WrbA